MSQPVDRDCSIKQGSTIKKQNLQHKHALQRRKEGQKNISNAQSMPSALAEFTNKRLDNAESRTVRTNTSGHTPFGSFCSHHPFSIFGGYATP